MNANEVKNLAVRIAETSLAAGVSDAAVMAKIRLYFTLDTDREKEWAEEFAGYHIDQHGAAATIRKLVGKSGGQGPAADLLGVDPATVSRYLSGGEPSRPVVKLARMLLEHQF